jgi:hypothetical protein
VAKLTQRIECLLRIVFAVASVTWVIGALAIGFILFAYRGTHGPLQTY